MECVEKGAREAGVEWLRGLVVGDEVNKVMAGVGTLKEMTGHWRVLKRRLTKYDLVFSLHFLNIYF